MSRDESWVDPLPQGVPLESRVNRLEDMADDYHRLTIEGVDLTDEVGRLASAGHSISVSLARLEATRRRLNGVIVGALVTMVLVLAGAFATYLWLIDGRLREAEFRQSNAVLCEQRQSQADAIRLFAELEIDRTQRSTLLTPDQIDERVSALETIGRDFPGEDCARLRN